MQLHLTMDYQAYTKYRPNETVGGIFVSWRRLEGILFFIISAFGNMLLGLYPVAGSLDLLPTGEVTKMHDLACICRVLQHRFWLSYYTD